MSKIEKMNIDTNVNDKINELIDWVNNEELMKRVNAIDRPEKEPDPVHHPQDLIKPYQAAHNVVRQVKAGGFDAEVKEAQYKVIHKR